MTVIIYGIKNCDTVKKARKFLDANNVDYTFHDFREDGLNPIQLAAWASELGWEALLNKRSTTWRNLPDETKANINEVLALAVMEDQPTLIKRPVLELSDRVVVGFNEQTYAELFK
ncbi:MAG: ArsC family reductase [Proteobacteria bacterium]|nr:MAG: ArsC family reductase [Pseudomonadota bacterium]